MHTWKVGDVRITRLQEQEPVWPGTMILKEAVADNVKREGEWLEPFCNDGNFRLSIHALLVESDGKRILVDTCVGNDKNSARLQGLEPSSSAVPRRTSRKLESRVIRSTLSCATHLHLDHVGWNTTLENGKWVPTFRRPST